MTLPNILKRLFRLELGKVIPERKEGEIDWTQAINRAIEEASTKRRKRVYFPSGTYNHDGILIDGNSELIIDGHKDAKLQLNPNSTNHCIEVKNSTGVRIRNISIFGNLQKQDTNLIDSRGIFFNNGAKTCSLDNISIRGTKGAGVHLGNVNQAVNVYVTATGGDGFIVGADCNLSNCQAGGTYGIGLNFQGSNTNASSVYSWMAGNNEPYALAQNPDADGIRVSGNSVVVNGFNVLASNRHGVYVSVVHGANISGTTDRCGRGAYYNNDSYGVLLNNSKSSIINVTVQNNEYDSVDDEGWTKTGVYVTNPNLGSINNFINIITGNVDVGYATNDINNIDKSNILTQRIQEDIINSKMVLEANVAETSVNEATTVYPTIVSTVNDGFTLSGDAITITKNGRYSLYALISYADNAEGVRIAEIRRGSDVLLADTQAPVTGTNTRIPLSGILRLNEGDQLRLRLFQNSGAELTATAQVRMNYIGR